MSSDKTYRTLKNINQKGETSEIMENCFIMSVTGINRPNILVSPCSIDPPFWL
jgi:hypothetical protein